MDIDARVNNVDVNVSISGGTNVSSDTPAPLAVNSPGVGGPQGVGIAQMEQTASSEKSEGVNTWTAILTNGKQYSFDVRNGAQGEPGEEPEEFTEDEWELLWATY